MATQQPVKVGHQLDNWCCAVSFGTIPDQDGEFVFACRWSRPQVTEEGAKIIVPVIDESKCLPVWYGQEYGLTDQTPAALKRPTR